MNPITIWAPRAERVELVASGGRFEMQRDSAGVWRLDEPRLVPGADYAFSVDGGKPLPDPRSRLQPQGVHGPSRVTSADFDWTDAAFRAQPLGSAILYELHVGTFAADGTFDGVIDRLQHLVELGVTHVELMPVAEFPGKRGWGYDGVDLFAPHSAYGGPAGLKRLVDACHAHDIAVVLDVVYNHLGPDGNYLPSFGPYLTEAHRTPWGAAVNLDGEHSSSVRRFFIDNALGWFREFHVDALRLDAVHAMVDLSARHFLRELAEEVAELSNALAKPLALIAESDQNDPRLIRAREAGGYGLDAVWVDDFHHAVHTVLTGERQGYYCDYGSLAQLARSLNRGFVYDGQYSPFRKRHYGEPLDPEISLRRLVAFVQNHDQVGNRARGERIGHLIPARRVRLGAALLLLGPFVPLLFQGEEWNASSPFQYFTDHQDPALARAVREGRRREFSMVDSEAVPDPQDPRTFEASRLDFDELDRAEHSAMYEFYRTLIALRRTRPELASPKLTAQANEADGSLVIRRDASVIAVNFGEKAVRVELEPRPSQRPELLLATEGASLQRDGVWLPPDALAVIAFEA
jgi:maltooligosyltrehalose trehalohydrolase